MTTLTKTRKAAGRRARRQHISDRRYYVQCAYRFGMAIISLVALIVITYHPGS
jgi:hypothetical protein